MKTLNQNLEISNSELSLNSSFGYNNFVENSGTNCSIANGNESAYKIICATGLKKARGIELELTLFSISTVDELLLSIGDYDTENLTYQIYTEDGRLLEDEKIEEESTIIEMSHFSTANYVIIVSEHNQTIKSFRILKQ